MAIHTVTKDFMHLYIWTQKPFQICRVLLCQPLQSRAYDSSAGYGDVEKNNFSALSLSLAPQLVVYAPTQEEKIKTFVCFCSVVKENC